MSIWTVAEIHELAQAIAGAGGDCFLVRRVLQRLEAGELTIHEAIAIFQALVAKHPT